MFPHLSTRKSLFHATQISCCDELQKPSKAMEGMTAGKEFKVRKRTWTVYEPCPFRSIFAGLWVQTFGLFSISYMIYMA
jgi:hypothetical protein